MSQLDAQHRRLDLVHARHGALHLAHVLALPAVHAQQSRSLGNVPVTGEQRPSVAERTQILGRIEAERGRVARTYRPAGR